MTKLIVKTFAILLALVGGVAVVVDAFGTGTANQYLFNLIYFTILLPLCIGGYFKARGEFDGITL